MTILMHKITQF